MEKVESGIKVIEVEGNDECVEITLPYTSNMTIYGNNDIIFNSTHLGDITKNKYLTDDRRKEWEDSDQSMRCKKSPFGESRLYVNQLLDFNVPYVIVKEGNLRQLTAIKVDNKNYVIDEKPKLENFGSTIHRLNEVWQVVAANSRRFKNSITISGDGRILNLDVTREQADKNLSYYLNSLMLFGGSYHLDPDIGIIVSDNDVSSPRIPDTIFELTKPVIIFYPETNPLDLKRISFEKIETYDNFIMMKHEFFKLKEYTQGQAENLLSRVDIDIKKNKKVPVLTKKGIKRPFQKIEGNQKNI